SGDHHAIRLRIGPYQEYVVTRVPETTFHIEGAGAIVPLPDPQPQCLRTAPPRFVLDARHQRLRDAPAMPRPIHIETPQLDRLAVGHTLGDLAGTHLRIGDRLPLFDE